MKPQSINVNDIETAFAGESMTQILCGCFAMMACAQGGLAIANEDAGAVSLTA